VLLLLLLLLLLRLLQSNMHFVNCILQIRSVKSHVVSIEVDYGDYTGSIAYTQKHGTSSNRYNRTWYRPFTTTVTEQVVTLREGQHLVSISGTCKTDEIGTLVRHLQFADNFGRVYGPYGHVVANAVVLPAGAVATAQQLAIGCRFEFAPAHHGVIRSFRSHSAANGLAAVGVSYSLDCAQHDVAAPAVEEEPAAEVPAVAAPVALVAIPAHDQLP
jgi:hypothetical protein